MGVCLTPNRLRHATPSQNIQRVIHQDVFYNSIVLACNREFYSQLSGKFSPLRPMFLCRSGHRLRFGRLHGFVFALLFGGYCWWLLVVFFDTKSATHMISDDFMVIFSLSIYTPCLNLFHISPQKPTEELTSSL